MPGVQRLTIPSFPVYHPDFQPKAYIESLKPRPLIEPEKLKTEQDWIEAGRRVFDELDFPGTRTTDARAFAFLQRQSYGVPWVEDDIHARFTTMSDEDMARLEASTGG